MTEMVQSLTLISSDGISFNIDRDAARVSGLVAKSLEDDEDDSCAVIQTPNVNSVTLRRVVDYMNLQKDNPTKNIKKSIQGPDFKKVIEAEMVDEYVTFFAEYDEATTTKMNELYDLMFGADFMEIPSLLELASAKLTCLGKSKHPGQIMELLTGTAVINPAP
jgi:hypothetical protein